MPPLQLTADEIDAIYASDDPAAAELQQLVYLAATHPYYTFEPRPDNLPESDEQTSFVTRNYRFDPAAGDYGKGAYVYETGDPNELDHRGQPIKFKICLGGTGSGKTHAGAYKTAAHVLEVDPPVDRCPFWIIGETMDQVCQAAWVEKLALLIPRSQIHSIGWHQHKRGWPRAVMLKYPDGRKDEDGRDRVGWVLEFKSYAEGLGGMKAVSIGGYWFNEEVPFHHVAEVQGRCRDYDSPGWADFTPIECRDPEWPESYEQIAASNREAKAGWRFYHLNTKCNPYISEQWKIDFFRNVPEDMRELRQYGRFTVLRGAVFKEFRKSIHVYDDDRFFDLTGRVTIPRDWRKFRGLDFGFNNPFACLWGAKDHDGRWWIYDEHFESQRLNAYHAAKIHEREWDASQPWYGPTYSDHDPQQRAELADLGVHCTPANKAINPGIEYLRSLMLVQDDDKPRLFISDKCVNLIREIVGYKWPEGTDKRNPVDVPMDVDNHAIDALRYMTYTEHHRPVRQGVVSKRVTVDGRRHGVLLSNGHGGNGKR